jgi:dihydroorotate dehydrogenase (NAD+) catalytic subunit
VEEYTEGARLLNASSIAIIELNISCPNVKAGGMAFGLDPDAAAFVVRSVRRAAPHKPLMVKLSPNAPDLCAVARACVNEGADALSLVNTFKALSIDIYRRKPVFDMVSAGLSGPAIRPIALRMVWEICDAVSVSVPVVGMGGIATPSDALEFLMAGATAIQVGSATFAHPPAMNEIIRGISAYMRQYHVAALADLRIRRTI